MHNKSFLLFLGIVFSLGLRAQDEVLMTINEAPVFTSEFKRVYLKNIDLVKDESQKDIDEYLDLFINYKLKLEEAKTLNLDKKETYIKELKGYKEQLSSNYLTDSDATEALIKEAYDRSLERIQASHILVTIQPNVKGKDTIKPYQKISEAREKILKGEDFKTVANQYSEDPSVKTNGGSLGWFSVFRMVYPFENAAYQTKKGEISEPFRTQFGYHIVKVDDREKTLGEVSVAHIMVAKNAKRTMEQAEVRVKEINQQLEQGASFESLAREYSDDRNTAVNGGKINQFAQGALNSLEFEKAAFGLESPGQVSQPVKSKYGWHIIKLIQKFPPKSFVEQKNQIARLIKRDSRSQLVTESFMNSLKKKYGVLDNMEAIEYFKKTIPATTLNENWELPEKNVAKKQLFTIKNNVFTYADFTQFLKENGNRGRKFKDIPFFVEKMYSDFEEGKLLQYYKEHLEEDNVDFANIVTEYRDGLLLFDLMETKIWNAAKNDSVGLQKFYEKRKDSYKQGEAYTLVKASSTNKENIDKVKKSLEKGLTIPEIKKQLGEKDAVIFSETQIEKGKDVLPKGFSGIKGQILIIEENNYITLIKVRDVIPAKIKPFDETKGKVINDYQEDLEQQWLKELRQKYVVEINKKTLKKIKKDLSI